MPLKCTRCHRYRCLLLRPALRKLLTQKYPNNKATPASNKNLTCASCPAPVPWMIPRCLHNPTPIVSAKSPKNTPVNSSQSTPDSLANGPHTASPKRLPSRFSPRPVS